MHQQYDYLIIGGGIFGCYAALYLAEKGAKIALVEKEDQLFRKASLVNQARLHSGYHYPRSVATAAMSDEHKARFTQEHSAFVNSSFEKYYAIDRQGSFTDARQFERFCAHLHIRCERVDAHPSFNYNRIEALYRTEEHSFDPVLLGMHYTKRVKNTKGITLFTKCRPTQSTIANDQWLVELSTTPTTSNNHLANPKESAANTVQTIRANIVINATYAATNGIHQLFGIPDIDLQHEISEIAFVTSPPLQNIGITIMDGPFGSLMPYGLSGLLSLSSVAYTHHAVSYEHLPSFECQQRNTLCTPAAPSICTDCLARPASNAYKMIRQMQQYLQESITLQYNHSYYTIKSKLKVSQIDDSRPTVISTLHSKPNFYCLFAGKINSIYEIEKVVDGI